jgi:acyl-[acyl-carrier-protein] desaturase
LRKKNRSTHSADYVDILQKLIEKWELRISNLLPMAEKARDYLMKLPGRWQEFQERLVLPEESKIFKS